MQFVRTVRLFWTFYRNFFLAAWLMTGCCLYIFWTHGFSVFSGIVWLKTATFVLTFLFINSYKQKEYYYYHNLGLSKTLLWVVTLTFDFLLFLFLITQTAKFR